MKRTLLTLMVCMMAGMAPAWSQLNERYVPALSLYVGTDVGGAVPGMNYIPKIFKPYIQLNLAVGAGVRFPLDQRVTLRSDIGYKTVRMDADAYVENQLAFVPDDGQPQGYLKQYYTGQAAMSMSFTMLEVPVYLSIGLGQTGRNKLLVGGYGAWIMRSNFQTDPLKGYIGSRPDVIENVVSEPSPEVSMNFRNVLSKWDAGLFLGYEYNIYERINIGFRFLAGFKDIFYSDVYPNDPEVSKVLEYRMTHMRGAITVSYDLFNHKGVWVNH
ncbi:MAG: outer membrane beta-barrel protein [Paludibacteraceae bacterium]|nr:outer membrane beta-barrel protein [Paludibacteraceae bacterium]